MKKRKIPVRCLLSPSQRRAILRRYEDRCYVLDGIDWDKLTVDGTNIFSWDELIDAVGPRCTARTLSKFLSRLHKEAIARDFTSMCVVGGIMLVHKTVTFNSGLKTRRKKENGKEDKEDRNS